MREASDAFLARVLRHGPAAVVCCESSGVVTFASERARALLGNDLVGSLLASLVEPLFRPALDGLLEALVSGRGADAEPGRGVRVGAGSSGRRRILRLDGRVLDDGGRLVLVLCLHDDGDRQVVDQHDAPRPTDLDPLTLVGDWRSFADRLRAGLRATRSEGGRPAGCIAVMTVDDLASLNDRFGFRTGDDVLRTISDVLRTTLPEDTWTARLAGDEFGCLFPGRDVHEAARLLRGALDVVRAQTLALTGAVEVTLSAGVVALAGAAAQDVMSSADVAAFQAKAEGGGRVVVHGPASEVWLGDRRQVAATVERLAARAQALAGEARTDALTGLLNRRALEERFAELDALGEAGRRAQDSYAILFADVDRFGRYNHAHGDAAGDRALQIVARVLERSSREGDEAYRKGGEEFVLVLPSADLPIGTAVAERVRRHLESLAVAHGGSPDTPVLTMTIGVDVARAGMPAAQVCDRAATAAYEAKEAGRRNSVSTASDPG